MACTFCINCVFWEKLAIDVASAGVCHQGNVAQQVQVNYSDIDMESQAVLWVAPYFGCIHWRARQQAVVDISDHVKISAE